MSRSVGERSEICMASRRRVSWVMKWMLCTIDNKETDKKACIIGLPRLATGEERHGVPAADWCSKQLSGHLPASHLRNSSSRQLLTYFHPSPEHPLWLSIHPQLESFYHRKADYDRPPCASSMGLTLYLHLSQSRRGVWVVSTPAGLVISSSPLNFYYSAQTAKTHCSTSDPILVLTPLCTGLSSPPLDLRIVLTLQ